MLVVGGDYSVTITGAQNSATGSYLNSATAAWTLYTSAGVSVATGSLSYVAASDGNYVGVIENAVTSTLTVGAAYYVVLTLTQSGVDMAPRRINETAQAPGSVLVDADIWSRYTGISLSATDRASIDAYSRSISSALEKMCDPIQLTPLTLTLDAFDAPPSVELFLPRPIRSLTLYLHHGANGDSSVLDLTADLLVAGTHYYNPVTDKRRRWNGDGIVYRKGVSEWGTEWRRKSGNLAYSVDPNRGAIFVTGLFGPASVDDSVQAAAVQAVTLLYQRRQLGTPVQSNSWNGGSVSFAGPFTAEGAVNSPEVLSLLRDAGVLPVHVAG